MEPRNIDQVESRELLIQTDKYKVVCFVFEEGDGLPNHRHDGLAAIQVVSGSVDMAFTTGEQCVLKAGDMLGFDARITHNVIAKEKSKILVTIIL